MDIIDMIMNLMDRYCWMTASFARYVIEHDIDIEAYV